MNITKELVQKLYDPNITKREFDQIVAAINKKVNEIWHFIIDESSRKMTWWAFSNDVSYGHGNGSSGGSFDPEVDQSFINIEGEASWHDSELYEYNDGFPTNFLWIDYQKEVKKHLKNITKATVVKETEKKKKLGNFKKLVKSIKSKLTKEELQLVVFRKS